MKLQDELVDISADLREPMTWAPVFREGYRHNEVLTMKRRLTRWLVPLCLSVLLLSNEYSALAINRITFSVSDAVASEDEAYVREGLKLATDYLDRVFGAELQHDLVVNIRETAHPTNPGIIAFASTDFLVIFSGSPVWDTLSPAVRVQVLIHEFIHIYQDDVLGVRDDASPMWFIEGMAEYVAFAAIESVGLIRAGAVYDYQAWTVRSDWDAVPELHEIEGIEDYQGSTGPVYGLSFLAVDRLLVDDSMEPLVLYASEVSSGIPWREAFEHAFGTSLADFYAEFDLWITNDFIAPAKIPSALKSISGVERDAVVKISVIPDSATPGQQIVVIAKTEITSVCHFRLFDEDGDIVSSFETVSDATGQIFWLKTLPRSLRDEEVRVMVNCGADPDTAMIAVSQPLESIRDASAVVRSLELADVFGVVRRSDKSRVQNDSWDMDDQRVGLFSSYKATELAIGAARRLT